MAHPRLYTTHGIIIGRRVIGEADRLLTVFTREFGKKIIVAKGIRRIKSRRAPRLELLSHVSLFLYKGKTWDTVSDVTMISPFAGIGTSLSRLSVAYYLCELVDALLPRDQEHEDVYALLVEGLTTIEHCEEEQLEVIQANYSIVLLRHLGYLASIQILAPHDIRTYIERIVERKLKTYAFLTKNVVTL